LAPHVCSTWQEDPEDRSLIVKGLIGKGQAARFYRRKIKKGMRVTSVNGEVPIPGCGESAINLVTTKDRPLTIGACNASHSTAMSFCATGSIALRSYLVRVVQYAG
jgi:hypothetical protein